MSKTATIYRLRRVGTDCVIDLVDDDLAIRDAAHRFLGGHSSEFLAESYSNITERQCHEYADSITRELSKESSGTRLIRYWIVDNFLPIADVGREIVLRSKNLWAIVITDSGAFEDSDIDNECYLGWMPKKELPTLCSALSKVLEGTADHQWIRQQMRQSNDKGRRESIRNLKHEIVNLLKPIVIDLESVYQVWRSSGDEAALSELREIFAAHVSEQNFYQQKITQIRLLAVGGLQLRGSSGLEFDSQWLRLCNLLGLRKDDVGYVAMDDSPISCFIRRMDEVKDSTNAHKSPSKLIEFIFQSSLDPDGNSSLVGFSSWFNGLCESLESIQNRA